MVSAVHFGYLIKKCLQKLPRELNVLCDIAFEAIDVANIMIISYINGLANFSTAALLYHIINKSISNLE